MDTFLAVIVAGMMFLFAFRIVSAILKSEIFWIFVGLVILIGFFSKRDNSPDNSQQQDNASYTASGDKYLEEGGVFCLSEAALDKQTELLAAGIMEYAPQCFSAARDIKVEMLDFQILGGVAKVVGVDSGNEMWTTSEFLIKK